MEWINLEEAAAGAGWGKEKKKRASREMKSVVEIRLPAPLFPG